MLSDVVKKYLYLTVVCKKCDSGFIVTATNMGHCPRCGKEIEGDELSQ